MQGPLLGGGTCWVPPWGAASSFEAQCECVVACWAGPCWPCCSREGKHVEIPGGGILGLGERPTLLLGQEEAVLVLRTSQKVSTTAGLVSSGYFLASKPQLAGLGEAASRAAFCFSCYSWELKVLTFQGLNPAPSSTDLCEQGYFYSSSACVLKGIKTNFVPINI